MYIVDKLVEPILEKARIEMIEHARQEAIDGAIDAVSAQLQSDAETTGKQTGRCSTNYNCAYMLWQSGGEST